MGNSLFEQLKKSGLVDEKKARKVKQSQYKSAKQKGKKGVASRVDETALQAQKARDEKAARDRQLNLQKKQAAEQKAVAAQIKQLIETNRVQNSEGEIAYNFTDANIVKRLHVSEQIHQHLVSGRLSIARLADSYALVPTPVADKITQRDAQYIIVTGAVTETGTGADDPYADYEIPDDLMW